MFFLGNLRRAGLVLSLLLAAGACRDLPMLAAGTGLVVEPAAVHLAPAWVGHRATAPLVLRNPNRAPLEVRLEVTAPFTVPATLRLPAGERLAVDVGLTPLAPGAVSGLVTVRWLDQEQAVPVSALAQTPPACDAPTCRTATFDAAQGACVESPAADGTTCDGADACLVDATCHAGACVGRGVDCDDGNACTADACASATGCFHEDTSAACPAATVPCRVPVCDPKTGCALVVAADGTACGPNDCRTAQVCMAGACVARAAPEGSSCTEATLCRGAGVCRGTQCEVPAPTALQPVWTVTPAPGHRMAFHGHADDDGNLYATDHWVMTDGNLRDVEVTDLVSFTRDGVERWRARVVAECPNCAWGLSPAIDSTAKRLYVNALGRTHALSTVDGHELWSVDATAGLPAYDTRADGSGVFYTSSPVVLAGGRVGVPVSEGEEDHHAYVRALEGATGQQAWQFHRKGHLYGLGASGDGDLWVSSANCWAPAGEMARLDAAGSAQALRFIQGIPAVYGADFGIGTAQAELQRIDGALDTRRLGASPGYSARMLVTGSTVIVFQSSEGTLAALDADGGQTRWTFRGVSGASPDFQLTRDGGVAWTASTTDAGVLGAVDGEGHERFTCPLATTVESPTAIIRGRAYVETKGGIAAYALPGLDVEPQGWVATGGSLERSKRAR